MLKTAVLAALGLLFILATTTAAQVSVHSPECVSFDTLYNRWLVSSYYRGLVVGIDTSGQIDTLISGLGRAFSHQIVDTLLYISTGKTVQGFSLRTGDLIKYISVSGSVQLDGMAADTSGNLYVTDYTYSDPNPDRIFKIRLSDNSYTVFVTSNGGFAPTPQDIIFDAKYNRLLAVGFTSDAPIQAISLADGAITNVADPPVGNFDGIAMDKYRNVYISSWNPNTVYRYDSNFTEPPELLYTGTAGISNINVNIRDNILGIPMFDLGQVAFYDLNLQLIADTTYGWAPFTVAFRGSSNLPVNLWSWDFGDGETGLEKSLSHLFETPGSFITSLQIDVDGDGTFTKSRPIYILADTLKASSADGDPGAQVEVTISAHNFVPLNKLIIPINYSGTLNPVLDSGSTIGCRTASFYHFGRAFYDSANSLVEYEIWNETPGPADLSPGNGPILKLYFTIPAAAVFGQTAMILTDGFPTHMPRFYSTSFDYEPRPVSGQVSLSGICGDANDDKVVNIKDITFIINYLYREGPEPGNLNAVDVNGDNVANIKDITYLINYLYRNGPALKCP